MDALETAFKQHLQHDGWWTKSAEKSDVKDSGKDPEVDIIAYNPHTGKMFYGNLTHLSHDEDESKLIL
jgi:hypothetical protein